MRKNKEELNSEEEIRELKLIIEEQNKRISKIELFNKPKMQEILKYIENTKKNIILYPELVDKFPSLKCFSWKTQFFDIINHLGFRYCKGIGKYTGRIVNIKANIDYDIAVRKFYGTKAGKTIKKSDIITPKIIKIIYEIFSERLLKGNTPDLLLKKKY